MTIPLSQLSTAGLAPRDTADASALSNMMHNLGGSIGIAMLTTMIDRREHMHFSVLAEAITVNATRTQDRLAALAAGLHGHIADQAAAKGAAIGMLASQVRRKATVMACADGFYLRRQLRAQLWRRGHPQEAAADGGPRGGPLNLPLDRVVTSRRVTVR
ncbi:hypothetical protein QO001_006121 [Methylobacterium brachiatum]|uniref:Uncharacterized protein n=1 Tax=Methylobacterium brachiatum TaxID=269660 RepID=A0AAJ1WZM9_9HYPH|nr:hypothetical protein [Methylobacterium brachiatum]MCB4805892.1 hypothetical protein [Methylobacterium brachiatum]MDQ0547165.1 hypothetical protein [Methylobacterium brachiatum]